MAFRYRARSAVADGGEGLGGRPLDLLEVVVPLAHLVAHGRVGRPRAPAPPPHRVGAAGGCDDRSWTRSYSATRCSRAASSSRAEGRRYGRRSAWWRGILLHVGQGHLELGPPVGGCRRQEVGGTAAKGPGQLAAPSRGEAPGAHSRAATDRRAAGRPPARAPPASGRPDGGSGGAVARRPGGQRQGIDRIGRHRGEKFLTSSR